VLDIDTEYHFAVSEEGDNDQLCPELLECQI
jgi:hypothetical protein